MTTIRDLHARAKAEAKETGRKISEIKAEFAYKFVAEVDYSDCELTVISYGGGVDSTAILLRMLDEGWQKFGIDPDNLIIMMAQTGNEYPDLADLAEDHLLHRLFGVRFVQVARQNSTIESAFTVLDDSYAPTELLIEGDYSLAAEMFTAGTIPQSGGKRLCSIKSKGWPLDAFIASVVPAGTPYRHIIGFEVNEMGRVLKDLFAGSPDRRPCYPLVDWGWNRQKCLDYIEEQLGVRWVKSACFFCPFAGQGSEKDNLADRWAKYPELGAEALVMEYVSQALNERQTLFGGRKKNSKGELGAWDQGSAIKFAAERELTDVLVAYALRLQELPWAIYRIRRIWTSPSIASRSVEIVDRGTKFEAIAHMEYAEPTVEHPGHVIHRRIISSKGDSFPCVEEMFVAAPALVAPKTPKGFNTKGEP
jgi:hypothetical protein